MLAEANRFLAREIENIAPLVKQAREAHAEMLELLSRPGTKTALRLLIRNQRNARTRQLRVNMQVLTVATELYGRLPDHPQLAKHFASSVYRRYLQSHPKPLNRARDDVTLDRVRKVLRAHPLFSSLLRSSRHTR